MIASNVIADTGDVALEFGRRELCVGLDAIQHARRDDLLQAAITEPTDSKHRERDQEDHRDGKPGGERHPGRRLDVLRRRMAGRCQQGGFGIIGQTLHRVSGRPL